MQSFKLNETDILSNQDWTFPTNIAYGPGRLKEIGRICNNLNIKIQYPQSKQNLILAKY